MKSIIGYHFTGDNLRNGKAIPPKGEWLKYDGEKPIKPCFRGLHASVHPFDALQYAPGNTLHRVELRGDLQSHGDPVDKWVGRERRIVATINAEKLLRDFARWNALQVIHLWHCSDVVRKYLETGDESLRDAAWAAARDAALAAARAAARDAARDAAWAAALASALAAARDAAWAAFITKSRDRLLEMVNEAFKESK